MNTSVPPNWMTPPVYARFSVQLGKMLDEKQITGTHLAPYLRNIDVQWDHVNTTDLPEMDFSDDDRERYALRLGDLLVCEGGEVGRTAIWDGTITECYFQKAIHRLRPLTPNDDPRFFRYFMRMAVETDVFAQTTASTIQHLTAEKLRLVRYPAPPIQQQRIIADYLDGETSRLDRLVRAKQNVLRLLAEKRRALITRAVTRGIGTDVPRRESGIPWLGDIPAHWQMWKLGHLAFVGNGSTPNRDNADYWMEGTIPWLNSAVVNQEEVTAADQFVTPDALRECHLPLVRRDSVLVAITGQGKTRGQATILSFDATVSQHLAYISPKTSHLDAWFLRWVFFAAYEFLRIISDDAGGTKGALTCQEVAGLRVPVPAIDEQRSIVQYITTESMKLDALRAATGRSIALLRERRSALIAAAVTGQIQMEEGT